MLARDVHGLTIDLILHIQQVLDYQLREPEQLDEGFVRERADIFLADIGEADVLQELLQHLYVDVLNKVVYIDTRDFSEAKSARSRLKKEALLRVGVDVLVTWELGQRIRSRREARLLLRHRFLLLHHVSGPSTVTLARNWLRSQ